MIPGIVAKGVTVAGGGGGPGDPMDDDFSGGTLDAKWTWRQQNAAVVNVAGGVGDFIGDPATADPTVHQIYQAVPALTGIFRALVAGHVNTNFAIAGLHLRDSVSGALVVYGYHNNSLGRRMVVIRFNNETSYNTNAVEIADPDPDAFYYLELELTATNIIFRTSPDAVTWTDRLNESKLAFFPLAPDQIGFAVCVFGAAVNQHLELDSFTRLA